MKYLNIIRRHAEMVFDLERSLPLIRAIEKTVRPGDVVVDLGCGLGVLSFAAVNAGAKRVYAIDVDSGALDFAQWQAKQLGMEKRICFFNDHSYHVDLSEKADLLIQETIGRLAFDENFLPTLIDAKKRFLKPSGKIIPAKVALVGAPVDFKRKFIAKSSFLAEITSKSVKNRSISIKKSWELAKKSNFKGILV
ncbi:MAG: 50S ribosomal protein L11 methyltransferase, partial [Deltaproteobacteria bacterium]|nr:50S ribosomal protein L11 methyltransferase [Deltaproteobacteria bacterium]